MVNIMGQEEAGALIKNIISPSLDYVRAARLSTPGLF